MKPLMIEVGLNEATTKAENPNVPYAPEEIARDILAVADAQASIVHFHARDPETGAQRMNDTELYREAMAKVRAEGCDILIYPTYPPYLLDPEPRFAHVRDLARDPGLAMNIGPLDMGTFNLIKLVDGRFTDSSYLPMEMSVYTNMFLHLRDMLAWYAEHELLASLAVFEPGHLRTIAGFLHQKAVHGRPLVKFFFSDEWVHGLLPDRAGLEGYVHMLDALHIRDAVEWFAVPYAVNDQAAVDVLIDGAIELGGHVRLGVGDLPVASRGRTNAELVADVVGRADAAGRPVATSADVLALCRAQ